MAITEISRDWGTNPAIVRITTTDNLATALGSTYLADQADTIEELNKGEFNWVASDSVLLKHSAGTSLLVYDAANETLSTGSQAISQVAEVTVTSAELLAVRATPVELIPAPGEGLILWLESVELYLDFNTTPYTIANSTDDLLVRYTDATGVPASNTIQSTGFLDLSADGAAFYGINPLAASPTQGTFAALANQPLVLDNIGAAEYTLGDSPVIIRLNYRISAVPF